jgi:hypothetical protein
MTIRKQKPVTTAEKAPNWPQKIFSSIKITQWHHGRVSFLTVRRTRFPLRVPLASFQAFRGIRPDRFHALRFLALPSLSYAVPSYALPVPCPLQLLRRGRRCGAIGRDAVPVVWSAVPSSWRCGASGLGMRCFPVSFPVPCP